MRRYVATVAAGMMLTACSQTSDTRFLSVADLPLKSTTMPSFSIDQAPLRANARYITYDARTARERALKIGDYYFVRWYDAHPEEPVRLVMHYTQAATGATKLLRELRLDEPRQGPNVMMTRFFYTGEERAKKGDVMTWKLELYSGGKLKDVRCSYLWRDTPKSPVVHKPVETAQPVGASGQPATGEPAEPASAPAGSGALPPAEPATGSPQEELSPAAAPSTPGTQAAL